MFIPASELVLNADGSIYHLGLLPEMVASTIIVVGDPERVPRVSCHFDSIEHQVQRREFVTHTGYYNGKRLTVISSGMGTDNVEILMTELDALFNIDLHTRTVKEQHTTLQIIRVGTSGSLHSDLPIGSVVLSSIAIGLDTLMQFYPLYQSDSEQMIARQIRQEVIGQLTPYCVTASPDLMAIFSDITQGFTLTCPGFYAPQGRNIRLKSPVHQLLQKYMNFQIGNYQITNLEMETAGYYAFARMLGHQAVSLSALLASRFSGEFAENPNEIVDNLIQLVLNRISAN